MTTQRPELVVIGGGLAGLAAAIAATDAGWHVTVLESRARLGGATHSFTRAFENGQLIVDNGQHVFLRCCTEYRRFLRRLGVESDTHLQPRLDVPVVDPSTGRRARLTRDRLPAPLHLARTLLRYRVLSPAQRLRAIWGALLLRRVDRDAWPADQQSFGDWLRAHGQTPETIERLFDVFTVATLNAPADQASLRLAAMVFQDGLLRHAGACDIGYATVPLGRLHGAAAGRALVAGGAEVRLHTRVRAIERTADRWCVRTDSETFNADAVVLATPHDIASGLLPRELVGADIADAPAKLGTSPILNVHVVYDRVVMSEPFVAAVGSPVQFVFDRSAASGLTTGQYVAVSVSAADRWIDEPVHALRELFVAELERVLPASRGAVVRDFFVTRERSATFRPAPGSAAHRLPATTPAAGLVIAGAWSDTGWPATMESAVRSGIAAVKVLAALPAPDDEPAGIDGMHSPASGLTRHDEAEIVGPDERPHGIETAEEALA